jgi:ABC-type glycerol-3-phosphate transport system substrate-binding protein
MSKSVSFFLVFILVTSLFSSGCSQKIEAKMENEETKNEIPKIRFAHNWTGGDSKASFYEPALQEFAEKNKDKFELVFEANLVTSHEDKMKVDLASDDIADVFLYWVGSSYLSPFVSKNKIITTEEFTEISKITEVEQWPDSAYKDFIIEEKKYGFPVEAFRGFFLVNKSLFDKYKLEYPKTYEELKNVSKTFNENGIVPICVGSKGGNPGHFFLDAITYQFDKGYDDAMSIATNNNFSTAANIKSAQILEEMVNANMFPADTITNGDWGPSLDIYNESKAAMTYTFPWMIGSLDESVKENSEIITFPTMTDAVIDHNDFYIGGVAMGYQISAKSFADTTKRDAIVSLVDYLVSDEMFSILAKTSMFPAKNANLDTDGVDPLYIKVNDFTNKQKNMYFGSFTTNPTSETRELRFSSIDELFAGALTGQQFVDNVQEEFDKLEKE